MLDRMAQNTTNSITVRDFLTQIENIMAHNTTFNWRAPIRGTDGIGMYKSICNVIERDRGLNTGVDAIILDLTDDESIAQFQYSIHTLKNKLISLSAAHPLYLHLPILMGFHPEVADVNGLTVRDFSTMLDGTVPGICVMEATGPR